MSVIIFRYTSSLELFHNVVLAYAPKRSPFQYVYMFICYVCKLAVLCNRNQSYNTRIQIAVLNYNAHLDCEKAKTKCGDVVYIQKFQKQTKNGMPLHHWSTKIRLHNVPDLLKEIKTLHI